MAVRWSCFAYDSRFRACIALKETYCRTDSKCPFYKSKEAYEKECREIEKRLGIGKVRDGNE